MNLEGSIIRKYYYKDGSDFPAYVGTSFILIVVSFLVISFLFWVNIDYIQDLTQIPRPWLKYALLVSVSQFVVSAMLAIFQVKVKPIKYALLQISQSILNISLTVILIVGFNKTWDGRIEAQAVTMVVFAVISFYILIRNNQIKINILKKDIQHALKFGIPLIPHAIGGILFTTIDRIFLTNLIGLEQTGNFSVSYQIAAVIGLITVSFNNAFVPWLFENLNKNSLAIKRKIVKLTYLYFVSLLICAILLILLFPFLVNVFVGSSYKSVNTYSAFIIFGFVFQGMYFMVTNYITYVEKTYLLAASTISVALLKVPITYYSIIWFGEIGAALSYAITFFIFFIATWILSLRVYKMPWFTFFK